MSAESRSSTQRSALLILLLLLSFYCRLKDVDLTWFHGDQTRDVLQARDIASLRSFPLLGPQTTGAIFHLGPLYYYVISIPALVSRDPILILYFVAALDAASVLLLYSLALQFTSRWAAASAALFFATYPLGVFTARALWNPALICPLVILFFYALARLALASDSKHAVTLAVAGASLPQINFATIAVFPSLLILLFCKPKIEKRHLVYGLLSFTLILSPLLYYELTHGFENLGGFLRYALKLQRTGESIWPHLPARIWDVLAMNALITPQWLMGHSYAKLYALLQYVQALCFLAGICLVTAYALIPLWRFKGLSARHSALLLALWFWLGLFVVLNKKDEVWYYYFEFLFPVLFISAGIALDEISRRVKEIVALPVALALACSVVASQFFFLHLWWNQTARSGKIILSWDQLHLRRLHGEGASRLDYFELMPLRYKRDIARTLAYDFGLSRAGVWSHVHGPRFYDFVADGGYWVEFYASGAPSTALGADIVLCNIADPLWAHIKRSNAQTSKLIGPYVLFGYFPLIDKASWRFSYDLRPGWYEESFDDSGWAGLKVPARDVPVLERFTEYLPLLWGGAQVLCRGRVLVNDAIKSFKLFLFIRGDAQVEELYVNGNKISRLEIYGPPSFRYWACEIGDRLGAGDNLIAFKIIGYARFDLDVFEIHFRQ